MAASIMNPYVKRSIKVKSLSDMTAKEKFSPLTSNLISKYQTFFTEVSGNVAADTGPWTRNTSIPRLLAEKHLGLNPNLLSQSLCLN